MTKPQVVLAIGIPGSGKTNFLNKFKQKVPDAVYICPDNLREQIAGDASDQTENTKVWNMVDITIQKALHAGTSVILDATQTETKYRKKYITLAKEEGAEVIGLYFDIPLEVAIERNSFRERKVPEDIIKTMHKRIEGSPPTLKEGFTKLFVVNEDGEISREITSEIKEMKIS